MTDSEFKRLWPYWAPSKFHNKVFEKYIPHPGQHHCCSMKYSLYFYWAVPTKYDWWGEPTTAQIHTESFSLHAFLYLFIFLCIDYSSQLFKFWPTKILPLKDSPQTSTIFFRTTTLLFKTKTMYFISHVPLKIFSLYCNYFNYICPYSTQF